MSRLVGKSLVIIGGTTGLGLSASKACVAAGARVVAVGRNPERVAEAEILFDDAGRALVGDAADAHTAPRAIELAISALGGFDGLYHVAGGSGRSQGDGPLHEVTDEGVDFTLRSNLVSLTYSNRAAVQQFMRQQTGGSIVNMASVLADSPAPHFFATHVYAATKAAAVGLTKACAAYYAAQDIRFNVVAPALVATPMSQRAVGNDAILDYIKTKQPLDGGRIGQPEDVDAAVVYLLSDDSKFVTGQVIAVDGGWSVSEGQIHQPT